MQNLNLLSGFARGRLYFLELGFGNRKGWIQEDRDQRTFRDKLAQKPEALGLQLGREKINSGGVAAWPIEAANEAECDWITTNAEDKRCGRGCGLGLNGCYAAACRHEHRNRQANQLGGQGEQTVILTFGPAECDRYVLTLDITCFPQALAKREYRLLPW